MYYIIIRVRLYHVITNAGAGDTNYGSLYLRHIHYTKRMESP